MEWLYHSLNLDDFFITEVLIVTGGLITTGWLSWGSIVADLLPLVIIASF